MFLVFINKSRDTMPFKSFLKVGIMLYVGVFSLPKSVLMLSNSGYSIAEFKQIVIVPQYANLAHSVV